jgi:choline dehydrogenase
VGNGSRGSVAAASADFDRLVANGDGIVGVETAAGLLKADTVVLAAGAYGSPGILLRSGIGPENGLPVGEGLIDHVGVGLGWEPSDRLQQEAARFPSRAPALHGQVTIRGRSSVCPEGVHDLFAFPALEPGYEISAAVFAMKPASRGSVGLNSRDPAAPLAIEHGFLAAPPDAEVLAEGVEQLRELTRTDTVKTYAAREARPGLTVDAAAYVREAARGFFHPVGTCAIGSVVDGDGRMHGFENLVVADASIMPTIPRANTSLSTGPSRSGLPSGCRIGAWRSTHLTVSALQATTRPTSCSDANRLRS